MINSTDDKFNAMIQRKVDDLQSQLDAANARVAMLEAAVKHALPYIYNDRCVMCGDERGYTCDHCEPLVNALQANATDWLAQQKAEAVRQFARSILHGDDQHRAWLIETAEKWEAQ